MGVKSYDQLGFADYLTPDRVTRARRTLMRIDAVVDWAPFAQILAEVRDPKMGRKGYPPLLMFKALLLAQWHNLSDPMLEDEISDRSSFKKFIGLPADEPTPDETAFVRFRKALRAKGLEQRLFDEVVCQLDANGLILRKGTLMDATIIEASVKRPKYEDGPVSEADPSAEFTKKNDKTYFGYKLHIGLDQDSGLIRKQHSSGASLHDSKAAYELISGDEAQVCADKAYDSQELRDELKRCGIKDRVMRKEPRGRKGSSWQKWLNRALSSIRFEVEQPFGIGKVSYGLGRTRYRGVSAVSTGNNLFCMAYNLRRGFG